MEVTKALLEKYYSGHCNETEKQLVEEWLLRPEGFTGRQVLSNTASSRMWQQIYARTIDARRHYIATVAAIVCLLWYIWPAAPVATVVIDNTNHHLFRKEQIGDLSVSESANSGWKRIGKDRQVYTNSLIINNQKGKDT